MAEACIDVAALVAFANEAAAYFEKRDTGGEDMAHWSNVYNAENCRKIATALQSQADALAEARRENEALTNRAEVAEYKQQQAINEILPMALTRATTAEASLATMREALEDAKHFVQQHYEPSDDSDFALKQRIDRALGGTNAE